MNEAVVIENDYCPTKPAAEFHGSDASIIVLVGGLGSGKSFAAVKEMEQSALNWPGIPMAVYRKTMPALRDSTLHEFREHSDESLGEWKAREDTYRYINDSFCRFRGLDEATKAKSTNYALIVMEEAEEFSFEEFRRLNERVRSKGPWPLRIILVLNPVDESHWIYKQFVENAAEWEANGGLKVIHFSTYDNVDNLPEGYIPRVIAGMTPDEIDRYINGRWGTIIKGKPVYANILNADIHLRTMERFPGQTLLRGWDFGFNHPAVSFRLVDQFGRMNIAQEMLGEKIDLPEFAPQVIQRTLQIFGRDVQIFDYGDPRGHDKAQNGKETCFEVLQEFGINAIGERGTRSYVEKGIKAIKNEFCQLIEGVPKLTIDPSCSLIRAAYFGKYVRGDDGHPIKDGWYEHICDADRYISHHHSMQNAVKEAMAQQQDRQKFRRSMRSSVTGY
jgi:phage terminase large subunit